MFVATDLAAQIDCAEGRLCSGTAAAIAKLRPEYRTLVLPIAGGEAVFVHAQSPLNKVIGLGFDGPLKSNEFDRLETEWRSRGEPVRVELSTLAHPSCGEFLCERGYKLKGFENQLGRPITDVGSIPSGIAVEPIHNDIDAEIFIDISVTAFANVDGTGQVADNPFERKFLKRVLQEAALSPGIKRYLARIDGCPVGAAAMRVDCKLAQLAGAGTLPEFRRRGVQKALLRQRLCDAHAAGCELAVVTTAPGTRSQENVMRQGFSLLYARAILVKSSS